jgi:Flp pilus assembly protein TadD
MFAPDNKKTRHGSMEKRHLTGTTLLVAATLVLSGCGGLGKMKKYVENIKYTIDPNPLIVQGDSVAVNINGNFPGKYFHKKAQVELTPTLVYSGGDTPMKTAYFQGEGAAGNYTVVPYETGKAFNYSDKIAYTPAMQESELMLMILGRQGTKEVPFDPFKLADGVITTPYLMMSDDKVLLGKDAFQRITAHSEEATINYLVNSSVVRPGELTQADVRNMASFIRGFAKKGNIELKGMVIDAWASPEGELSLNENLASDRAKSAQSWSRGELTRAKSDAVKADGFYQLNPRGEDWEGFKKAMKASDIADKELVLRVLEMYADVAKREQEIKNMAATYNEIADRILPALRRSEMKLNYERVGKTDEQITAMSKNMPDSLNVEELLWAATLTTDLNEQMRIYRETERVHPSDYRGANNVGYVLMMQNKMAEAETQFQKANSIQENPVSTNNLGVVARLKGDRKKAAELYNKSLAAGPEVKYNLGIVNIQNGDYGAANSNMSGTNSFNAALAKMLGGDAAGAQRILDQSAEKDSAMGHYLMAIIGARQNNGDMVRNNLGLAVQKDASLREKAMKDLEFRNFKGQLGL